MNLLLAAALLATTPSPPLCVVGTGVVHVGFCYGPQVGDGEPDFGRCGETVVYPVPQYVQTCTDIL